jgi:hypothetical protein
MECTRPGCPFLRHPNLGNNGGTHCCAACKRTGGHGPVCRQISLEEATEAKEKADNHDAYEGDDKGYYNGFYNYEGGDNDNKGGNDNNNDNDNDNKGGYDNNAGSYDNDNDNDNVGSYDNNNNDDDNAGSYDDNDNDNDNAGSYDNNDHGAKFFNGC